MVSPMSPALNTRAEILLKTLIERYIADGQPVGSRTLARQAGLDLSPATVRNIVADLEDMGLVHSRTPRRTRAHRPRLPSVHRYSA